MLPWGWLAGHGCYQADGRAPIMYAKIISAIRKLGIRSSLSYRKWRRMDHLNRLSKDLQTGMIVCFVVAVLAALYSMGRVLSVAMLLAVACTVAGTVCAVGFVMCKVLAAFREDMDSRE